MQSELGIQELEDFLSFLQTFKTHLHDSQFHKLLHSKLTSISKYLHFHSPSATTTCTTNNANTTTNNELKNDLPQNLLPQLEQLHKKLNLPQKQLTYLYFQYAQQKIKEIKRPLLESAIIVYFQRRKLQMNIMIEICLLGYDSDVPQTVTEMMIEFIHSFLFSGATGGTSGSTSGGNSSNVLLKELEIIEMNVYSLMIENALGNTSAIHHAKSQNLSLLQCFQKLTYSQSHQQSHLQTHPQAHLAQSLTQGQSQSYSHNEGQSIETFQSLSLLEEYKCIYRIINLILWNDHQLPFTFFQQTVDFLTRHLLPQVGSESSAGVSAGLGAGMEWRYKILGMGIMSHIALLCGCVLNIDMYTVQSVYVSGGLDDSIIKGVGEKLKYCFESLSPATPGNSGNITAGNAGGSTGGSNGSTGSNNVRNVIWTLILVYCKRILEVYPVFEKYITLSQSDIESHLEMVITKEVLQQFGEFVEFGYIGEILFLIPTLVSTNTDISSKTMSGSVSGSTRGISAGSNNRWSVYDEGGEYLKDMMMEQLRVFLFHLFTQMSDFVRRLKSVSTPGTITTTNTPGTLTTPGSVGSNTSSNDNNEKLIQILHLLTITGFFKTDYLLPILKTSMFRHTLRYIYDERLDAEVKCMYFYVLSALGNGFGGSGLMFEYLSGGSAVGQGGAGQGVGSTGAGGVFGINWQYIVGALEWYTRESQPTSTTTNTTTATANLPTITTSNPTSTHPTTTTTTTHPTTSTNTTNTEPKNWSRNDVILLNSLLKILSTIIRQNAYVRWQMYSQQDMVGRCISLLGGVGVPLVVRVCVFECLCGFAMGCTTGSTAGGGGGLGGSKGAVVGGVTMDEVKERVWQCMESVGVVSSGSSTVGGGGVLGDLQGIEMFEERYPQTLTFLQLLSTLLTLSTTNGTAAELDNAEEEEAYLQSILNTVDIGGDWDGLLMNQNGQLIERLHLVPYTTSKGVYIPQTLNSGSMAKYIDYLLHLLLLVEKFPFSIIEEKVLMYHLIFDILHKLISSVEYNGILEVMRDIEQCEKNGELLKSAELRDGLGREIGGMSGVYLLSRVLSGSSGNVGECILQVGEMYLGQCGSELGDGVSGVSGMLECWMKLLLVVLRVEGVFLDRIVPLLQRHSTTQTTATSTGTSTSNMSSNWIKGKTMYGMNTLLHQHHKVLLDLCHLSYSPECSELQKSLALCILREVFTSGQSSGSHSVSGGSTVNGRGGMTSSTAGMSVLKHALDRDLIISGFANILHDCSTTTTSGSGSGVSGGGSLVVGVILLDLVCKCLKGNLKNDSIFLVERGSIFLESLLLLLRGATGAASTTSATSTGTTGVEGGDLRNIKYTSIPVYIHTPILMKLYTLGLRIIYEILSQQSGFMEIYEVLKEFGLFSSGGGSGGAGGGMFVPALFHYGSFFCTGTSIEGIEAVGQAQGSSSVKELEIVQLQYELYSVYLKVFALLIHLSKYMNDLSYYHNLVEQLFREDWILLLMKCILQTPRELRLSMSGGSGLSKEGLFWNPMMHKFQYLIPSGGVGQGVVCQEGVGGVEEEKKKYNLYQKCMYYRELSIIGGYDILLLVITSQNESSSQSSGQSAGAGGVSSHSGTHTSSQSQRERESILKLLTEVKEEDRIGRYTQLLYIYGSGDSILLETVLDILSSSGQTSSGQQSTAGDIAFLVGYLLRLDIEKLSSGVIGRVVEVVLMYLIKYGGRIDSDSDTEDVLSKCMIFEVLSKYITSCTTTYTTDTGNTGNSSSNNVVVEVLKKQTLLNPLMEIYIHFFINHYHSLTDDLLELYHSYSSLLLILLDIPGLLNKQSLKNVLSRMKFDIRPTSEEYLYFGMVLGPLLETMGLLGCWNGDSVGFGEWILKDWWRSRSGVFLMCSLVKYYSLIFTTSNTIAGISTSSSSTSTGSEGVMNQVNQILMTALCISDWLHSVQLETQEEVEMSQKHGRLLLWTSITTTTTSNTGSKGSGNVETMFHEEIVEGCLGLIRDCLLVLYSINNNSNTESKGSTSKGSDMPLFKDLFKYAKYLNGFIELLTHLHSQTTTTNNNTNIEIIQSIVELMVLLMDQYLSHRPGLLEETFKNMMPLLNKYAVGGRSRSDFGVGGKLGSTGGGVKGMDLVTLFVEKYRAVVAGNGENMSE